ALALFRLDCMVALGIAKEEINGCGLGFVAPDNGKLGNKVWVEGPLALEKLTAYPYLKIVQAIEKQVESGGARLVEEGKQERALLVGVDLPKMSRWGIEDSLAELAELAV
ncbi:MAG TPA: hypothetical protein DEA44_00115, partial [Firmicutes bacterium]|nr:hypothetical protein [Bacillota bacterium]